MNHQPISNLNEPASPEAPDVYEVVAEESRHTQQYRQPERVIGPAVSVFLHALFLFIAALLVINPPVRGNGTDIPVEFATLADEELTKIDEHPNDALNSPVDPSLTTAADSPDLFKVDAASVAVDLSDPGAIDTLGGAGEEFSPGEILGGGGAGTSFFGIESRGSRFVYIVDVSGSMAESDRISTLRSNLIESMNTLPEQASFLIIAYSDNAFVMDNEYRWNRADNETKFKVRTWIINHVAPSGGTEPSSAFEQAFKLKPRPDVIYFMTDGQQTDLLPGFIRAMNTRGRRTKINTIVFGDRQGEEVMRRIASESGGQYRYISDGGGRP